MKRNTASAIAGLLMETKINKVTDKAAKTALFGSFLAVNKVSRDLNAESDDLRKKFYEDWKEEFPVVSTLRDKGMSLDGHEECLKAEADANEALRLLGEQEVDVDIAAAPRECLQDPDLWGEEDTLGLIAAKIDFLAENGILS